MFRGVFQSLIERHFPSLDNDFGGGRCSPEPLTLQSSSIKHNNSTKPKLQRNRSSGFASEDEPDSDYERNFLENDEFDSDVDKFSDHGQSNSGSENEREDDEFNENEVDDVNPFAVGNNSDEGDDCPWLKKSVKNVKSLSSRKPQKQKRKREEHEADFMGLCNKSTKKLRSRSLVSEQQKGLFASVVYR